MDRGSRRSRLLVGATAVVLAVAGCGGSTTTARKAVPAEAPVTAAAAESTRGSKLSVEELAARYGPAVYRVEADQCGGRVSGSAFAIDRRHLVTNYHVVALDLFPRLVAKSGESVRARVVGSSESPDVAVLEVDRDLPLSLRFAPPGSLDEGERLVVLGYPVPAGAFTVQPGYLNSFKVAGTRRLAVRTDAKVDHGDSGGPALTEEGLVAGVVTEFDAEAPTTTPVGLAYTYDALGPSITRAFGPSPANDAVSCAALEAMVERWWAEVVQSERWVTDPPAVADDASPYGEDWEPAELPPWDPGYADVPAGASDPTTTWAPAWEPPPAWVPPDPPAYEPPAYEPPGYEEPTTTPPGGDPTSAEPQVGEPPAYEPPAYEPPAAESPGDEPPSAAESRTYDPPTTEPPAYYPPVRGPVATESPANDPPATSPRADEPPATEPRTREAPEEDEEPSATLPDPDPPAAEPRADEPPATELGPEADDPPTTELAPEPTPNAEAVEEGAEGDAVSGDG